VIPASIQPEILKRGSGVAAGDGDTTASPASAKDRRAIPNVTMTKIRKTLFISVDQGVLSTNQSVELIESEVEADDIDAGIPEDTQIRPFGVLPNERSHLIR